MGQGVAFQAPHIFRPPPPPPRPVAGPPTGAKPTVIVPITSLPKILGPQPVLGPRPGILPPARLQPPTIVDYGLPPSQGPVLTGPIAGPGITDTGFTPPTPPPGVSVGGGGGDGGGGSGGVTVGASARIPWLTIALIAGGLYLVTS